MGKFRIGQFFHIRTQLERWLRAERGETISQAVSSEGAFGAANFERIVSTLISTSENVGPAAYFEADSGIGLKTFISRPSAEPSASEKSFCMRTHANFKSFIELRISHTAF